MNKFEQPERGKGPMHLRIVRNEDADDVSSKSEVKPEISPILANKLGPREALEALDSLAAAPDYAGKVLQEKREARGSDRYTDAKEG